MNTSFLGCNICSSSCVIISGGCWCVCVGAGRKLRSTWGRGAVPCSSRNWWHLWCLSCGQHRSRVLPEQSVGLKVLHSWLWTWFKIVLYSPFHFIHFHPTSPSLFMSVYVLNHYWIIQREPLDCKWIQNAHSRNEWEKWWWYAFWEEQIFPEWKAKHKEMRQCLWPSNDLDMVCPPKAHVLEILFLTAVLGGKTFRKDSWFFFFPAVSFYCFGTALSKSGLS